MRLTVLPLFVALASAACVPVAPPPLAPPPPVEVQLLAFNDFHGNLEPPAPVELVDRDGVARTYQTGGAAHLAARLKALRAGQAHSVTVAAGDLIGASPLTSAWYLDEPTIAALDLIGLDYAAIGNHEFDKGWAELQRMQHGGCAVLANRQPCALEPFQGARFRYLAANAVRPDGSTLFDGTALKDFGPVKVGFIGMTLKETKALVAPSSVAGLTFTDEAETANRLADGLVAQGANAVVLMIHQGARTAALTTGGGCDLVSGELRPILPRLKPSITTIVSGHTHSAYVCPPGGPTGSALLTSAGRYGYMVSDIRLTFDPVTKALVGQRAENLLVGDGDEDPTVQSLVDRYVAAVRPHGDRVIGRLTAAAPNAADDFESPAADLIADAFLAATRSPATGGAQLALINASGVRVTFPAGVVRYRDAFSVMPFGNTLVVKAMTGHQIKAVLEQQYAKVAKSGAVRPSAIAPSIGFSYDLDLARPAGERVVAMRLGGTPLALESTYRVVTNNYLAAGGDGLTAFDAGRVVADGVADIEALIAWVAKGRTPPVADRVRLLPH